MPKNPYAKLISIVVVMGLLVCFLLLISGYFTDRGGSHMENTTGGVSPYSIARGTVRESNPENGMLALAAYQVNRQQAEEDMVFDFSHTAEKISSLAPGDVIEVGYFFDTENNRYIGDVVRFLKA